MECHSTELRLCVLENSQFLWPVVGTEIQTSCNFKSSLRDRFYLMTFARCLFSNALLESPYNLLIWDHLYITVSSNLDFQSISYTKIFLISHHHQNQVQGHVQEPNQTNQLHIARYKKAVSRAIWLQLTLVACYLPYGIVEALRAKGGLSASIYHAWS